MEREIAFSADGHAERAVAEHLEADGLSGGSADVLLPDCAGYDGDLVEIQLPGEDHHVGPPGIEADGLGVADVDLGGYVDLLSDGAGVEDGGHV